MTLALWAGHIWDGGAAGSLITLGLEAAPCRGYLDRGSLFGLGIEKKKKKSAQN